MRTWVVALALTCGLGAAEPGAIGHRVTQIPLHDLAGNAAVFPLTAKATAVVFISTICPISNLYNDRMSALYREFAAQGVQLLFVNANSNETPAEMSAHRIQAEFPFAVYQDKGNAAADLIGAASTPEAFVFDAKGVLRYRGAIDDAKNPARVKHDSLRLALRQVLNGQSVATPQTKAFGCTIHRVRKSS